MVGKPKPPSFQKNFSTYTFFEMCTNNILTEFRVGNAKLGNRDDHLKDLAVSNHQDRVVAKPISAN